MACIFPAGVSFTDLRNKGAVIWENPADVPFEAFRAHMYDQKELQRRDRIIYTHYMTQVSVF